MELALNLVWAILAIVGLTYCLCSSGPERVSRRTQFVAVAMLLLILFPVISVTDDFWAARNPAEADTSLRRNDQPACHHTIAPDIAIVPHVYAIEPHLAFLGHMNARQDEAQVPQAPARSVLFTRPPPAA